MNRILIIGLGSIGQRHVKALLALGEKKIAALRTQKGQSKILHEIENRVQFFYDEKEALLWKPTHIIISNPTSLHARAIKLAINNDIKFFVEKPVFATIDESRNFENLNSEILISAFVGYQLRFHGLFSFIKQKIDAGDYGALITGQLNVGHYLPFWHPYEDYRKSYYAKKSLGGGALRTLSHELDIVRFLFSKVKTVYASIEKLSSLEIDVDDVCDIILTTEKCKKVIIHINFIDPQLERKGKLFFEKGKMEYDFVNGEVDFVDYESKIKKGIYKSTESYDDQYINQMRSFLSGQHEGACTYPEGLETMKLINACELSNFEKKEICLD